MQRYPEKEQDYLRDRQAFLCSLGSALSRDAPDWLADVRAQHSSFGSWLRDQDDGSTGFWLPLDRAADTSSYRQSRGSVSSRVGSTADGYHSARSREPTGLSIVAGGRHADREGDGDPAWSMPTTAHHHQRERERVASADRETAGAGGARRSYTPETRREFVDVADRGRSYARVSVDIDRIDRGDRDRDLDRDRDRDLESVRERSRRANAEHERTHGRANALLC